jgi:hypothetical protein
MCEIRQRTFRKPHTRLTIVKDIKSLLKSLAQAFDVTPWMEHFPRVGAHTILACFQYHDQSIEARQNLAQRPAYDMIPRRRRRYSYVGGLKGVRLRNCQPRRLLDVQVKFTYLQVVKLDFTSTPDRIVETVLIRYYPNTFVGVVPVDVLPLSRFSILIALAAVVALWYSLHVVSNFLVPGLDR